MTERPMPIGPAAAALAAVRAYRRAVPPKAPPKPRQRARQKADGPMSPDYPPGVPPAWCEGVALLPTLPPPVSIKAGRWRAFASTAARLLRDHGAALHGAGWDALDLFGLHRTHPATNPAGWGLAWLLGTAGEVLDIGPDVIGMRRGPDGAQMTFRRRGAAARAGVVLSWAIRGDRDDC